MSENDDLNDALRDAVLRHDVLEVQSLLERGANAAARALDDGSTALHYAAIDRHVEIAALLLQSPTVDVNAQDMHGHTPLHHAAGVAAFPNGAEMLCLLLRHGADRGRKDRSGETPVCAARRRESHGAAPVSYLFDFN